MRVFSAPGSAPRSAPGPRVGSLASALGLAVLLSGCAAYENTTSWLDRGTSSAFAGVAGVGENIGMPWGGTRPRSPGDSLTVERVTGATTAAAEPLQPEPGNVWPEREPPRTTLMNPDQALRGIPGYPSPLAGEHGAPPPITPQAAPEGEQPQPPPPRRRRGAAGPFVPAPTAGEPAPPPPQSALPSVQYPPPERPAGGQAIHTPQGVITPSTQSGNFGTFNEPGGGAGTITRDGNTVIINRPGEAPQIVPAPR